MRRDLKPYLVKNIPVDEFYQEVLDDYKPGENSKCPFHEDDTPSLSIRREDGAFFCHGCGAKGTSLVGFYEMYSKEPYLDVISKLYGRWIRPIVPLKRVSRWSHRLQNSSKIMRWIEKNRGVNSFTAKMLKLGWDGERIVIPIINEFGLCINVRRYHPKLKPKILSYRKGYGAGALFPLNQLRENEEILLVEGEWDAILGWQMGYNTVTSTGGAANWNGDHNGYLKGKKVAIFYDNDGPGRKGSTKVARSLMDISEQVKVVPGPSPTIEGCKDLTDYVLRGRLRREDVDQLITRAKIISGDEKTRVKGTEVDSKQSREPPQGTSKTVGEEEVQKVKLHEASKSSMFYRPIETEAHVAGKRLTPYLPPKRFSVRCRMDRGKLCQSCHMLPRNGYRKFTIPYTDRRILALVETSDASVRQTIKDYARIPYGCSINVETISTFNMEEITVIPPIDDLGGSYTARRAYYIGHGLASNRGYVFEGYTVPHPKDQTATHIFTSAETAQSHLETYELTPEVIGRLRKFSPGKTSVLERVHKIEKFLSKRVTKIIERRTMHMAIDLVFHSAISFYFNNEKVKKGWLEAAIIGDTRCGKGFVATELVRFYGLGEIATAENCSFAGLIGGLMKMGNTFSITWGVIPRNTDRLVIIDETSGLSQDDISKMTRVRSEGIAEIFKIQSEATQARTRLIWLSNTRSGKPVNTYSYGVEAVSELFGKAEDVSKLDFALLVRGGDVSAEMINAPRELLKEDDEYEQEDFRNLIMWIWTRSPTQIFFEDEATSFILRASLDFGKRYHPSIPLIQVEDVRIKIARLSVAIAGRVFSSDPTGKNLVVTKECAEGAVSFLREIYDNPPTSYRSYSQVRIEASTIRNEKRVIQIINETGNMRGHFIRGLLENQIIGITDISDFLGIDKYSSKGIIGELVRNRCLAKQYTHYVKCPPFIELLRRIQ